MLLTEQWSISPTYHVQLLHRYFCAKKVQTLNLSTKELRAKLSHEKAALKMLVKLTPGIPYSTNTCNVSYLVKYYIALYHMRINKSSIIIIISFGI
jgi:hypothetical protein